MKMHEVRFAERPPIDGYGPGVFRIADRVHEGGLLHLPARVTVWTPGDPLTPADFAEVVAAAGEIDILLLGMGVEIAPTPPEARAALEAAGVGVEVMATPPAARTFNVLLAEARRVAAALIPV